MRVDYPAAADDDAPAAARARIAHAHIQRIGHFMNPALLHSQFETLEPPAGAIQVDITPPPTSIATVEIIEHSGASSSEN